MKKLILVLLTLTFVVGAVLPTASADLSCAWCLRDACTTFPDGRTFCCDQKDTNCNGECEIIADSCQYVSTN